MKRLILAGLLMSALAASPAWAGWDTSRLSGPCRVPIYGTPTISAGARYTSAITYDGAGRYQVATNGGLGTAATGKTGPGVTTTLNLGSTLGSNQADSYIKRLAIYPQAFSDAQLQALTQ